MRARRVRRAFDDLERFLVRTFVRERLCEVVDDRHRIGMPCQGASQHRFHIIQLAQRVERVRCSRRARRASVRGVVGMQSPRPWRSPHARTQRALPDSVCGPPWRECDRAGQPPWPSNRCRAMCVRTARTASTSGATRPSAARDCPSARCSPRARVVPAVERTGTVILKHDDGRARRDLAQQVFEARRERVGDHSISARSGKHLHLHAAFALRYVDLPYEVVRRDAHLEVRKRRRERGRPALIIALRKERRPGEPRPPRRAQRATCREALRFEERAPRSLAARRPTKRPRSRGRFRSVGAARLSATPVPTMSPRPR